MAVFQKNFGEPWKKRNISKYSKDIDINNDDIFSFKTLFIWPQKHKIWKAKRMKEQAGAELGQPQDKLKVIVDVGVEFHVKVGFEVEAQVNHY